MKKPLLKAGEVYLCGLTNKHGDIEHTIFVATNNQCLTREAQREWAKSVGGILMDRFDALAIGHGHRDLVLPEAYWTNNDYEDDSAFAWYQSYEDGGQGHADKGVALRAVAVRKVVEPAAFDADESASTSAESHNAQPTPTAAPSDTPLYAPTLTDNAPEPDVCRRSDYDAPAGGGGSFGGAGASGDWSSSSSSYDSSSSSDSGSSSSFE